MSNRIQAYFQSVLKKQRLLPLSIWLLSTIHAYADWNPSDCIKEHESLIQSQDPRFLMLKEHICKSLENSWCSAEKAKLIMDLVLLTRPQVCVEIGAFTGSSVLPAAATLKYLNHGHLYAIDAWSNEDAVKHINVNDLSYQWWLHVDMQRVRSLFDTLINQWSLDSHCSVIHASSQIAINQIPEIDFLHLDGNFSEEGSLLDVQLYLPKVKSGGYILLSNLFASIHGSHTKMPAMWKLFDECDIICEIGIDAALFRKN